jgi:glucose-1-phosphate cytidylyltransferase
LNYLVTYFEKQGLRKFIIAAGYQSDKVYEYFKNNHKNLEIQIIDSGDVDILTRIQAASQFISDDFIMCYGDTLADVDLSQLIDYHHIHGGILTVTSYPLQSSFGILEIGESGEVRSFMEKPVLDKWINIGYFYFSKECVRHINDSSSFVDFLKARIEREEMYSFQHRGIHITVNTITELREAENNIASFIKILNR